MDLLFDTADKTVMVAVDVRSYTGNIEPQYCSAAVLLTYPDDLPWIFGNAVEDKQWSYVHPFYRYEDYCAWLNRNNLELS